MKSHSKMYYTGYITIKNWKCVKINSVMLYTLFSAKLMDILKKLIQIQMWY